MKHVYLCKEVSNGVRVKQMFCLVTFSVTNCWVFYVEVHILRLVSKELLIALQTSCFALSIVIVELKRSLEELFRTAIFRTIID